MASEKKQAETFDQICYEAFQTHYKCVRNPGMPSPEAYWSKTEAARILWRGLVKGVLINTQDAQQQGLLPKLVESTPAPLPGLGGAPVAIVGNPGPAALATALAGRIRARAAEQTADTPPGLAVGRSTGDNEA